MYAGSEVEKSEKERIDLYKNLVNSISYSISAYLGLDLRMYNRDNILLTIYALIDDFISPTERDLTERYEMLDQRLDQIRYRQ